MKPLALLCALCLLTSCASWKKVNVEPEPPLIDCGERIPAETLPRLPATTHWLEWAAYGRAMLGVAEAEIGKRVATADCLDRDRASGRIR